VRILLALALSLPALATGQPYDPSFRWRTLDTEHFQVHFHQGEEALAQRTAAEAERAHQRLTPYMRFEPEERTQIVLSDDQDSANGSATPLPYDTIRLYAVAPSGRSELNDYRDWLQTLVQHEYVHILQLDQTGGVPRAFNRVFGKLWLPNGLLPAWVVEGIAVLNESAGDPATGRNASALYDMYARALVTEPPGFPSLRVATHPSLDWPVGAVPYLLGGKLMELIQQRRGERAIPAFVAEQGTRVWPWSPSWAGQRAFGKEFSALWDDLRDALAERYGRQLAEVRARPVTASTWLTRRGAKLENPRWSPDGAWLAWLDGSLDERSGIRRVTPKGADLGLALPVDATGSFALLSPTVAIASIGEIWHEFRYFEDLWRVDLASGTRTRLTDGERATDPDVRPGGDVVVYVARTDGGGMELRRRRLDGGKAETILTRPGAQLYSPRLSPDGTRIAFELHEGGHRDLAILKDGAVERVTDDDALDLDPAWSADGRWLFFSSDRGGIFNLYARGEDGTIRQVTNVETGALEPAPSPDGKTLAFVGFSREGYDLATMALDPASWMDPQPAPPAPDWAPYDDGPPLPSSPYSSLATVYPRWWLPILGYASTGWTLGGLTGGQDVLALHTWSLQGWYEQEHHFVGYSAAYEAGWLWPLLDARSSREVGVSQGLPYRYEEEWTPLAAGATFTFTTLASQFALRAGWIGTRYASLEDSQVSNAVPAELAFRDGFLSAGTLTAGWSNARRFRRSISREEGALAVVDLQFAGRELASDYSTSRARGVVAGFLRVPGTRHVVLATRLAGGVAHGSIGGRAPFRLGGLSLDEAGGVATSAFAGAGSDELRGYATGSLFGSGFLLANLELRFPIARPELGRTTWPLFLRRISGALFFDAGDAFEVGSTPRTADHRLALSTLQYGAGGELRLELFLAYYLPLEVRLGVARGLGNHPGATTQGYLTAGPVF
jgi:hypothetical protein